MAQKILNRACGYRSTVQRMRLGCMAALGHEEPQDNAQIKSAPKASKAPLWAVNLNLLLGLITQKNERRQVLHTLTSGNNKIFLLNGKWLGIVRDYLGGRRA